MYCLTRQVIKKHVLANRVLARRQPLKVLDVGGMDVNGSLRPLFERIGAMFVAVDAKSGCGVDMVSQSVSELPFPAGDFDVVVSASTLEHCQEFWNLFVEMTRVCAEDGILIVLAPSGGPIHRYPVDCYRFLPDAMKALATYASVDLVDCIENPAGPWFDTIGVFRPAAAALEPCRIEPGLSAALDRVHQPDPPEVDDKRVEISRGKVPARKFLLGLHRTFEPRA